MFNWKKEITQEVIDQPEKLILLSDEEFRNMAIDYEHGKLNSSDILVLFAYIIENEKWERFRYEWCIELMDHGVLTESGLVNPYQLKKYRESKAPTKF